MIGTRARKQVRWQTMALLLLCALLLAGGLDDVVKAETAGSSPLDEMLPKRRSKSIRRSQEPDQAKQEPDKPAESGDPSVLETAHPKPASEGSPDESSAPGQTDPASEPGSSDAAGVPQDKTPDEPDTAPERLDLGTGREARPAEAGLAPEPGTRQGKTLDTSAILLAMSRQTLILLYSVIGQAADLYTRGVYDRPQTERLFESYAGLIISSRAQFEALLAGGAPARSALEYQPFVAACDALYAQCAAYRKYLANNENAHLSEFAKRRESAWNAVSQAADLPTRAPARPASGTDTVPDATAPSAESDPSLPPDSDSAASPGDSPVDGLLEY